MSRLVVIAALPLIFIATLVFAKSPVLGGALMVLPLLAIATLPSPKFAILLCCFCVPFDRALIVLPGAGLTVTKVLTP